MQCHNDVRAPAYLRNGMMEAVTFDLSPIMTNECNNSSVSPLFRRMAGLEPTDGKFCKFTWGKHLQ